MDTILKGPLGGLALCVLLTCGVTVFSCRAKRAAKVLAKRQFGIAPLAVSLQPIGTDERLRHGNRRLAAIASYGVSWTTKYIGYDRLP